MRQLKIWVLLTCLISVVPQLCQAMYSEKDEKEKPCLPYMRTIEVRNAFPEDEKIYLKKLSINNSILISSTHKEGEEIKRGKDTRFQIIVLQDKIFNEGLYESYKNFLIDQGKNVDTLIIGNDGNDTKEAIFSVVNLLSSPSVLIEKNNMVVFATNVSTKRICFELSKASKN